MTTEKLSAYVRLPHVNTISNPPLLISTTSNSSGGKYENSLRKPRRKVGKTVSQLGSSTKTNTIWGTIRKISGRPQPTTLKHLTKKNKTEATTRKDIEVLAVTFSENSSLKNSNPQFISYKSKSKKQRLNFKTNNLEKYNLPFTPAELKEAIQTSHNTAVGPDEIHYEFLKHLKNSLNYLLKIFNNIWINGTFPESWKIATIIPISKPEKDNSNPANYRSIALVACVKQWST